ncbi:UNVERIFIED_CONTAM: hypothetical protein GTU68_034018 [Idotea baltica]|nr:hypothetical protein [Idotea baltica]
MIEDSRWEESDESYRKLCVKVFDEAVKEIDCKGIKEFEFSLKLTDDEELQELNASFRGKDKTTNVLSFPSQVLHEGNMNDFKNAKELYLGDMAISYDRVEEEANKYGISFENHFIHLVLHSILHLFGFDHIDDEDAYKMEELEKKILKRMNINNPYDLMALDVK